MRLGLPTLAAAVLGFFYFDEFAGLLSQTIDLGTRTIPAANAIKSP